MNNKFMSLLIGFYIFLSNLVERRSLIYEMTKREIASQHVGSLLGFFWTFINPLIWIFILWVVFSLGFKIQPKGNNIPFVVWLVAGMSIWITFTEIVSGSTGIIVNNSFLVKKMVFPLSILPVVKLVASFITHSVFLLILIILMLFYRMPIKLYCFQAIYYFVAMSILALGISWITSSINIFLRDINQIVNVFLQIGFWATPIFWDFTMMPPWVQSMLKLNPMFYIVQGYRESFIYAIPFWGHSFQTVCFWVIALSIFVLGAVIFRSLKPHFADVL
jgi:lipopolysaccharide transport system permease protein